MARPPLRRVEELFHRAADLEPAARTAFLDAECGGDSKLRAAVEELLRHDDGAGRTASFFDSPIERTAADVPPSDARRGESAAARLPPDAIAGYEILEKLGSGGMGVVFMARQTALQRLVALKMLLPASRITAERLARFQTEAEALARLQHPNIVQIYEIGEHQGRPYLVMEYVAGPNLARKLEDRPQPPQAAARLVEVLARAMQAVHDCGIIHRDLKPANILLQGVRAQGSGVSNEEAPAADYGLTTTDYGLPKVTDFGLAKDRAAQSQLTQPGMAMGTPSYMAPEQARGRGERVGPAADIYALGAILYETLTGRPPFIGAGPAETIAQVVSEEPISPARLRPALPLDLVTICLKCLEKDPGKRYPRAAELADDLQRFQEGRPIHARAIGPAGRTWRWCRRRPLVATLAAVSGLLTLGLIVIVLVYQARFQAALASRLEQTEEELTATEKQAQSSGHLAEEEQHQLAGLNGAVGMRDLEEGDSFTALVWLTEALRLDRGQQEIERKHRTWISLALQHCPRLVQLLTCNRRVLRAQVGSWGCWVTTAGDDGAIRILDMMTGLAAGPGFKPENGSLVVGISPDGRLIATAAADGTTQVWNRDSGELLGSPIHHAGPVVEASVSADDRVLLIRDTHSMVQLWDLSTRRGIPLDVGPEGVAVDAASSDDGYWLFTVHAGGRGRMWNTRTGRAASPALELGQHMVLAAPSADGRRVALIDADSGLWLLDAQTGNSRLLVASLRSEGMVNRVTFSPNGSPVLTVAGNRMRVWDAASGVPVAPPLWQRDTLLSAAFAGEQRLVAVGKDGVLRVWELPLERKASGKPGAERSATTGPKTVRAPRRIQLTDGMVIQVRTPATGAPVQPPRSYDRLIEHAAFSPDARRVATAIDGRTIQVWDTATGTPLAAPLVHKEIPAYVAFSPDGTRLVTASTARSVQVWDVGTGEPITPPLQHPYELRTVAFRSDGQRVVAVSTEGLERHWELTPDKRPVANLRSLAQVLSGRRHDGNSRLVPLDVAALRSAWDSSRPTSPNRASKPIR